MSAVANDALLTRERVVVCPGKLPDDFWTWLPDVQRIGEGAPEDAAEPEAPLPLPTAQVADELMWRAALAKLEAAKTCERAARTVAEARRVRAGQGTRWSEKAVQR